MFRLKIWLTVLLIIGALLPAEAARKAEVAPKKLPKVPLMWLREIKLGDPISKLRDRYFAHLEDSGFGWYANVPEEKAFFGYDDQTFYMAKCGAAQEEVLYRVVVRYRAKMFGDGSLFQYYSEQYGRPTILTSKEYIYSKAFRWVTQGSSELGQTATFYTNELTQELTLILEDNSILKRCVAADTQAAYLNEKKYYEPGAAPQKMLYSKDKGPYRKPTKNRYSVDQ